jgi:hypothetical protein
MQIKENLLGDGGGSLMRRQIELNAEINVPRDLNC